MGLITLVIRGDTADEIEQAAQASQLTVEQWLRITIAAALVPHEGPSEDGKALSTILEEAAV